MDGRAAHSAKTVVAADLARLEMVTKLVKWWIDGGRETANLESHDAPRTCCSDQPCSILRSLDFHHTNLCLCEWTLCDRDFGKVSQLIGNRFAEADNWFEWKKLYQVCQDSLRLWAYCSMIGARTFSHTPLPEYPLSTVDIYGAIYILPNILSSGKWP